MARVYTARDMRQAANAEELVGRPVVAAMLRQAADSMDREDKREKKYEYSEKYSDGEISPFHDEERIDLKYTLEGSVVVRRPVGEWEVLNG